MQLLDPEQRAAREARLRQEAARDLEAALGRASGPAEAAAAALAAADSGELDAGDTAAMLLREARRRAAGVDGGGGAAVAVAAAAAAAAGARGGENARLIASATRLKTTEIDASRVMAFGP